ncbi:MAG: 16S rRNA (cytosine(1402)-N(4))-methyltransferase RsmH [Parcubacteria group bacterium]
MTLHVPVLLQETIDLLDLSPGFVFVDGTLGGGGHSMEVSKRFGDSVRIIGIDQDPDALKRSTEALRALGANFITHVGNFRDIDKILNELEVGKVNAILLDIGLSSDQLAGERGFSFQKDAPLDMRMSKDGVTAADILNSWDEAALELTLRGFGEEKYSRRIAREIVARREVKPFQSTNDLLEAVHAAVPASYKHGRTNPATKTFQALRIAVNEELTALEVGLTKGFESLLPEGRMAVITFHSLEDRIVKNFFKTKVTEEEGTLISKKPLTATEEEVDRNPRSRSAKLRVIKKT